MSSNIDPNEFINAYSPISNNATLASAFHFEIPINAVFLTEDGSASDVGTWLSQIQIAIGHTNAFFTDNYSFYLCSYEVVEAPVDLLEFNNTTIEWETAYQLSHRDDAINVYYTPEIVIGGVPRGGYGRSPYSQSPNNAIFYSLSQMSRRDLLAHELGHYLGLLHTHNGFVVDPDDTSYPCENQGDLICETPMDPGRPTCSFGNCNETCEYVAPSGDIWEFTPDKANLMSYYQCIDHFVDEQFEVMSVFLFHHTGRNFLIRDEHSPNLSCVLIPEPNGFVVHPAISNSGETEFKPVIATDVTFYEQGQSNYFCNPDTGMDEFFTMNECNLTSATGDISYSVNRDLEINEFLNSGWSLNGVTTYDIVLTTKHILGIQPFTSPFQYIAADVNNSGTVSTLDIIRIRKLILGIITVFEEVPNWRFMPAVAEFDDVFWADFNINPFSATWNAPDFTDRGYLEVNGEKSYLDLVDLNTFSTIIEYEKVWSFYAIKSGDINGSAITDNDDFGGGGTSLFTETKSSTELVSSGINTSEVLLASISVGEYESFNLEGYQFSINFDDYNLELIAIEPGDIAFSSEDFVIDYQGAGATIKTLWNDFKAEGVPVTDQDKLFTLVFHPKSNLNSMNGLISFGNNGNFEDLIIANNEKLGLASLQVSFEKANLKDFLIKEAYGNPFTSEGNLHIKLELKEQKNVNILLQDEFGHVVILDYNNLVIGDNNIEISATTISYLQAGKVYYTISTDQDVQSGALIKL